LPIDEAGTERKPNFAQISPDKNGYSIPDGRPHRSTFGNCLGECIHSLVGEYHVGRTPRSTRTEFTQCNTHMGEANRRRVVCAITHHGYDATDSLKSSNDARLLRRSHPRKYRD
jgi:hypothetical protein